MADFHDSTWREEYKVINPPMRVSDAGERNKSLRPFECINLKMISFKALKSSTHNARHTMSQIS